jgi:hypothetical protein
VAALVVFAVVAGTIGWTAWAGGAQWRAGSASRFGRWGGLAVLWFGRLAVLVAVLSVGAAGLVAVTGAGFETCDGGATSGQSTVVFPDLPDGARRVRGFNGAKEAAANRRLRAEFARCPVRTSSA